MSNTSNSTIDLEEFNYKKIEKVEVDSLKEFHLEKNEDGKAKGLFLIIREVINGIT